MAIDAAGQIVSEEGLRGLTTRKVAGLLGYSPGTLYIMFSGLDDLILHVNARTLDELRSELVGRTVKERDPATTLRALGHAYLDYATRNRNRWRAVFDHRLTDEADLPAWYDAAIADVMSLVRAPVLALRRPADDAQLALETTAVWCAVHGVCELSVGRKLDAGGATDPAAVLDTIFDAIAIPR